MNPQLTESDWIVGALFAGALWMYAVVKLREAVDRDRRRRDSRALRRAAERANEQGGEAWR